MRRALYVAVCLVVASAILFAVDHHGRQHEAKNAGADGAAAEAAVFDVAPDAGPAPAKGSIRALPRIVLEPLEWNRASAVKSGELTPKELFWGEQRDKAWADAFEPLIAEGIETNLASFEGHDIDIADVECRQTGCRVSMETNPDTDALNLILDVLRSPDIGDVQQYGEVTSNGERASIAVYMVFDSGHLDPSAYVDSRKELRAREAAPAELRAHNATKDVGTGWTNGLTSSNPA